MQKLNFNIAIIVSIFNQAITDKLLQGALSSLLSAGIQKEQIEIVKVPGAVEIPLVTKMLARLKKYDAIICLGAVIQGETNHYDYVCQQVSSGCQSVMLEFNIPIIFGVLTTQTVNQAISRVGGKKGHKGVEAAETALHMLDLLTNLKAAVG